MGGILRRQFLIATGALLAAPLAAEAQPARSYRLGFLGLTSASDYAPYVNAFLLGLRELGYDEGGISSLNIAGRTDAKSAFPSLPLNWYGSIPTCSWRTRSAFRAVQQATSTIPIVMG
jgi:hypothetical protein